VNNNAPCDDGDVCTGDDHCTDGSCKGAFIDCNDHVFCTIDSCTQQTGCKHDPVPPPCCDTDADCADTDPCTVNERCVNNTCVSDPRNCSDNDPCTVDTCENAGGDFNCIHTPCFQLDGNQCPDNSCLPAFCGNGRIDPGETCDPPGSTTSKPGVLCRADCTFCGDNVVQPQDGETCDDGNTVEGCNHKGFPLDACQNNCTPPVCKDPTKALLSTSIDKFTFHGRLVYTGPVNFANNRFVIEVTKPGGAAIYRASLAENVIVSKSGGADGPFVYTNANAKLTGGIFKLKVVKQRQGFYKATVTSFGNLYGSEEDMVTHVHSGDGQWTVKGDWSQINPKVWRLNPATN
jgi:hypothetical protein